MLAQEIEQEIRNLPDDERKALVLKISDIYWDAWDEQIEEDFAAGKLDSLIAEAEAEIAEGKTRSLDEVINDG